MSNLVVETVPIDGQQVIEDDPFPLAMCCKSPATLNEATAWITENLETHNEKLERSGAVLFRGFPLQTADDFDAFIGAFGYPNFPYADSLSNAVRVNRTERVFTANEAPASVTICLHHEMAQTPIFPSKLFFFCEQPATVGGATPLCRSDALLRKLEDKFPSFVANCRAKGLRYTNVMPRADDPNSGMGRSWQSTLSVSDRSAAESRLQELGYSFEWQDDDCLKATTPVLPAIRSTGGREAFFNQLIAAFHGWKDHRNDPSKAVTFADGEPLDTTAMTAATELADELAFDIPWQAGDVALIDNRLVMHGRRTFQGTRKVLASLIASDG
ncbi:MAG: SyrP protein [Planctomycetaceae bacterium]|nr:SyrP protein [Planctomycetaceae bacterium]